VQRSWYLLKTFHGTTAHKNPVAATQRNVSPFPQYKQSFLMRTGVPQRYCTGISVPLSGQNDDRAAIPAPPDHCPARTFTTGYFLVNGCFCYVHGLCWTAGLGPARTNHKTCLAKYARLPKQTLAFWQGGSMNASKEPRPQRNEQLLADGWAVCVVCGNVQSAREESRWQK